ncbi:hypothetical protein C0J52_12063 [Blattella germanica]|nr:hypothetical protein C0J52_12063 [Blattella germanica]
MMTERNSSGPAPVPAPRIKKKQKLASNINMINIENGVNRIIPVVVPPKRKNKLKTPGKLQTVLNDCNHRNDNTQSVNHEIEIISVGTSTYFPVNNKYDNEATSFTKEGEKRSLLTLVNGKQNYSHLNLVNLKLEESGQYDSGVYLPEGMPSGECYKNSQISQTGFIFENEITQDTTALFSHLITPLEAEGNKENESASGDSIHQEKNSNLQTSENTQYVVNISQSSLTNNHSEIISSTPNNDTQSTFENIEDLIYDSVNRIHSLLECREEIVNNKDSNFDSPFGISILMDDHSDDVGKVFHERENDVSIRGSSNDNIIQLLISKESVPAENSLQDIDASISLLNISPNFSYLDEKSDDSVYSHKGCNDTGVIKIEKTFSAKSRPIIKEIMDLELLDVNSSDASVFDGTSNDCVGLDTLDKTGENKTISGKDCSSYSALDNFEAFRVKNHRKQDIVTIENEGQLITKGKNRYKRRFYKTKGEEIHPNKISENFDLFIKNMLMDGEDYDLNNYQCNETKGSVKFKEDGLNESFHHTTNEVTNIIDDNYNYTNKSPNCLEFQKEAHAEFSNGRKASPRCINVECDLKAGLLSDIVNNKSDIHNQLECDSAIANSLNGNSCALSVITVNTAVPSSQESCQSPLHSIQQHSMNSVDHNISKTPENPSKSYSTDFIIVEANNVNDVSSITISKSDTLPSDSADMKTKSSNIPYNQLSFSSQVPVVVKVKAKSVKKNDDFLDSFREKLENSSDFNKCDSENNNNTENISSEGSVLESSINEDFLNSDHNETVSNGEYQVTLEKIWGSLGIQIEVCINN